MLCLTTFTTGACVLRSTYDVAVADLEAKQAELNSTRTRSQAVTERVSQLQQLAFDLARQKEAASEALQQVKQQMETEQKYWQERISNLNRTISQLTAEQNSLRYALQRENEERLALQASGEKYPSKPAEAALTPPTQVAAQPDPAAKPTVTAPAASADPNAANPKPQPANKPTSGPVEDDWLSIFKEWIISLWRSIVS
jgi:septal ring factor EnvC (AmiA/AmiB activator)